MKGPIYIKVTDRNEVVEVGCRVILRSLPYIERVQASAEADE